MDIYHTSELQLLSFQGCKPRLREQALAKPRLNMHHYTPHVFLSVYTWVDGMGGCAGRLHSCIPSYPTRRPHVLRSLTGMKSDSTCSSANNAPMTSKNMPTAPAAQTTATAATSTITHTTSQSHNHIHNHQLRQQAVLSTTMTEKATSLLNPADSNFLAEHQVPRQRGYLVFHTHSP